MSPEQREKLQDQARAVVEAGERRRAILDSAELYRMLDGRAVVLCGEILVANLARPEARHLGRALAEE